MSVRSEIQESRDSPSLPDGWAVLAEGLSALRILRPRRTWGKRLLAQLTGSLG